MPHATEADIDQGTPTPQHGMATEADVLPEQSFGAGLKEYGHQMNPVSIAKGIWQTVSHPIDSAKEYLATKQKMVLDAEDSLSKGDWTGFIRHFQNAASPLPGIDVAVENATNKWESGDKAGALADGAALVSQQALLSKAPDIAQGAVNAGKYMAAATKAAAPGVLGGMAKAGAGELLAKVPGMELPARFGLQYPALRQVAKAIEKGHEAGTAALAPKAAEAAAEASASVESTLAGGTTVQDIGKGLGIKSWKNATAEQKAGAQKVFDQLKAQENGQGAPAAAAPSVAATRPPEYYGVKPAQTPPATPANNPPVSPPEPEVSAAPPAPGTPTATPKSPFPPSGTRTIVRFPQGGQPGSVTRVLPGEVQPIRTPEPESSPAGNTRETPGNQPKPAYHATRSVESAEGILKKGTIYPAGDPGNQSGSVSATTQPGKNYANAPVYFELDPTKTPLEPYDYFAGKPKTVNGETVPGYEGGPNDPRFEHEVRAKGAIPTSSVKAIHVNPSVSAEDAQAVKAAAAKAGVPVVENSPAFGAKATAPQAASKAPTATTAAKSARYADAIAKWAKDMGMTPKDIADQWGTTTPEVRGQIMLELKRKGYLGANETIPNTSAAGIVDALKAKAATIRPPAGFGMRSQY